MYLAPPPLSKVGLLCLVSEWDLSISSNQEFINIMIYSLKWKSYNIIQNLSFSFFKFSYSPNNHLSTFFSWFWLKAVLIICTFLQYIGFQHFTKSLNAPEVNLFETICNLGFYLFCRVCYFFNFWKTIKHEKGKFRKL